jgi:hypothetical protein
MRHTFSSRSQPVESNGENRMSSSLLKMKLFTLLALVLIVYLKHLPIVQEARENRREKRKEGKKERRTN